jgi:hypothetical protein
MRMAATYLEEAAFFQQMAAQENNPELKANLQGLAEAYQKAAALRMEYLNLQNSVKDGHQATNYQTPE